MKSSMKSIQSTLFLVLSWWLYFPNMQQLKFPEIWGNSSCNPDLLPAQLVKHMTFVEHVYTVHRNFSVLHGSTFLLICISQSDLVQWPNLYLTVEQNLLGAILVTTIAFSTYTLQGTVPQDPIPPALTFWSSVCWTSSDSSSTKGTITEKHLHIRIYIFTYMSYTGISVKVEIITAVNVLGTKDTHPY